VPRSLRLCRRRSLTLGVGSLPGDYMQKCSYCGLLENSDAASCCNECGTPFTSQPQAPSSLRTAPEIATGPQATTPEQREQSPAGFLEAVRRQTCYSALRGMIDLFAVLSISVIVILAGFYIWIGLKSESVLSLITGLVVGVLGCFLVIASKQASVLLVDIADTLIEQNRKKRSDSEDAA
jgi:hypothetical protein